MKGGPLTQQVTEQLELEPASGNRIPVNQDLTVGDRHDVRVIGDIAQHTDPRTMKEVPGVAQGALQMGTYAGRMIALQLSRPDSPKLSRPFAYRDKGTMATIGKGRAVLDAHGFHLSGFLAWVIWAIVHITFLINFRSRFAALWSWSWAYVLNNGINELIVDPIEREQPATAEST